MKVNNTIVISIGQAGNQIAASFWKTICQEHGIDPMTGQTAQGQTPRGNWSAFFSKLGESTSGSYVPRAVMVDLEPSVIDNIKATSGSLFNPGNLISRTEGAGGNFAVGYLGAGREVLPEVMGRLDAEIDKCDNVGGILVLHATGGGSGSGFGALLIETVKEKYPEFPILSCAVLPSPQVSSVVTEPYNTVFTLNTLRRSADACLIFDNEALFELAHRKWNIESPTVDDLNLLITEALAGLTASMRFSGFLTVEISLRELLTNLVPQPSLHFLMCAFAPLTPPDRSKFEEMGVEDMIRSLFDNGSVFAACSPMEGRFLSTAVLYRGIMDDKPLADAALAAMREQLPLTYWIPTAFKIGMSSSLASRTARAWCCWPTTPKSPVCLTGSATTLTNSGSARRSPTGTSTKACLKNRSTRSVLPPRSSFRAIRWPRKAAPKPRCRTARQTSHAAVPAWMTAVVVA